MKMTGRDWTVWPKENWSKVNDYNIKSNWCKKVKQKPHKRIYFQVLFDIIHTENYLIIDTEISN